MLIEPKEPINTGNTGGALTDTKLVHQALEFGASFDEIFEAVDVGIEMGGGPATVSIRFVIKVVEYYKNRVQPQT
jgi:hypothetical protein